MPGLMDCTECNALFVATISCCNDALLFIACLALLVYRVIVEHENKSEAKLPMTAVLLICSILYLIATIAIFETIFLQNPNISKHFPHH